ncbi:MAG: polyamine ABC transporter substrate-binding protein [Lysobacterales bacterium]|jgi:putrescine transport system substrate-binding protein
MSFLADSRVLRAALAALAAWLFCTAVFADEEKVLNVYNWADYIAPDTLKNFEAEYGIKVNYDVYDSTEVVEARLLAGKTGYDVVVDSTRYAGRMIPIGVFQPLDKSRLPLLKNLDPWVMKMLAASDPGNRYAVPYMWGTTGFAYNVDMIRKRMPDAPVDSMRMLFDPAVVSKFADCGVSLLDEPTDVINMVLLYLGLDPNSLDPADLAKVEAQMKKVRPYIRYFSSAKMINDMPSGQICLAMSWSGDYAQAMNRAREVGSDIKLAYTAPKEGSMLWFDGLLIPADAPHPHNAHLFINYLLRPDVIGAISNTTAYANANTKAAKYMRPEIVHNTDIYPPMSDRSRFSVGLIFGPKLERRRTRTWSRIKTGL